jgi:digeranylgeranylglycerophospholipid reductase
MAVDFPCDILVVGAGPAGSCAAAAAAGEGLHTVLIDAKMRIGEQPHCGEFVPTRLFAESGLDRSPVIHRVESMETHITDINGQETGPASPADSTKAVLTPSPGFLIDRVRFDRDLAREAAAAGATVLCATRLLRAEDSRWVARSGKEEIKFKPHFIIAADGALSGVARCLSLKQVDVLRGLQVEAPFSGTPDRTYVFLDKAIMGGYGWIFPKGRTANVGIGVFPGRDLDSGHILEQFLDHVFRSGLIRQGCLARSGGLIPVSGIRDALVVGNAVFCGDAAGLTHPITGAGIPQAVFSGQHAGRSVATTLRTGRRRYLADYEAEIKGRYKGIIDHALKKRRIMMEHWNDPDFAPVCERTWIAFKGYRLRERFK